LPDFPSPPTLETEDRHLFLFSSYTDWMVRCEPDHGASSLFKGKPSVWTGNLQYELYYWYTTLEEGLAMREPWLLFHLSQETVLQPRLFEFLALQQHPGVGGFDILDVGAGPLTVLGKRAASGAPLRIVAADPLACAYAAMLRQLGIDPPVPSVAVDAERLESRFRDATFHLVHSRNALDHAWDPIAAVWAMLRVVRPMGFIYLIHHRNEGFRQNYTMLHRWDFDIGGPTGGDFLIRSPQGAINMRLSISGLASVQAKILHEPPDDTEMIEVIIQRFSP